MSADEDKAEFEPDDERPWDEARWEEEFKRSDARAERFGELLETFADDPDRDEIVAREMGWDAFADELAKYPDSEGTEEDFDEDADDESFDADDLLARSDAAAGDSADHALDDDGDDDDADLFDDDCDELDAVRGSVKSIAAFVLARDVGMRIHHLLQPFMDGPDDDDDGRLGEAYIGCHIAAAKISGGHAMGYDDEVLCGNIVNNRIGLAAVEKSIAAFQSLKDDELLPPDLVDRILPELAKVSEAMSARIAELRAKVWW
jgi:hypothetical protein